MLEVLVLGSASACNPCQQQQQLRPIELFFPQLLPIAMLIPNSAAAFAADISESFSLPSRSACFELEFYIANDEWLAKRKRARTPTPGAYLGVRAALRGNSRGYGRDYDRERDRDRDNHSSRRSPRYSPYRGSRERDWERERDRSPRYSRKGSHGRDRSRSPQYSPYRR